MNMKRCSFRARTALLLAAGIFAATPAVASAGDNGGGPGGGTIAAQEADFSAQGGCGDDYDIDVGFPKVRARAGGSLWCSRGKIHFDGWVRDTLKDGKCAQVYGNVGSKSFSKSVCGKGDEAEVHASGKGSTAEIYLRTFKSGS